MSKKKPSAAQPNPGARITVDQLAGMMNNSFEHLTKKLDAIESSVGRQVHEVEQRITERLERIEFRLTGEDQRLSTLEDRMRQVATKFGIEFK